MSTRSWQKDRSRQLLRNRGAEASSRETPADIERAARGLPKRRDPRPKKDPIGRAAAWLIENRPRLRADSLHPVPELKRAFGLTAKECVDVIRRANDLEAQT